MSPSAALFRHRRFRHKAQSAAPAKPGLSIKSFDFWDTLITRWDVDPKRVFDLDHIYAALGSISRLVPSLYQTLMVLELGDQGHRAQPVQANLERLTAADMVISDMYLSTAQLHAIAKQRGLVWHQLRQAGLANLIRLQLLAVGSQGQNQTEGETGLGGLQLLRQLFLRFHRRH